LSSFNKIKCENLTAVKHPQKSIFYNLWAAVLLSGESMNFLENLFSAKDLDQIPQKFFIPQPNRLTKDHPCPEHLTIQKKRCLSMTSEDVGDNSN
jgi:hypothetical protein